MINSLFKFIEHFSDKSVDETRTDEEFEALSDEEKIAKLLLDGDRERMIPLVESAKDRVGADKIVNEILIDAMKVVGELFGSGEMQLPFVLQSAETMKATVDFLNPYLTQKGERIAITNSYLNLGDGLQGVGVVGHWNWLGETKFFG